MNETINLSIFWGAVKRNKIAILLIVIIPTILTLIITKFIPKRYTSSATLLCPEMMSNGSVSSGGGLSGVLSSFKKTSGNNNFTTQGFQILINSDYMCSDIIKKFDIKKLYKIKKKQDAISFVRNKLIKMDVIGAEGVILLSVTSKSPKLSKDIVEFIYTNLNKVNNELRLTTKTPLTRIVDRPYIPYKKSYPSTKLNVSIAILFGLLVSLIYVYLDIVKSNDRRKL